MHMYIRSNVPVEYQYQLANSTIQSFPPPILGFCIVCTCILHLYMYVCIHMH